MRSPLVPVLSIALLLATAACGTSEESNASASTPPSTATATASSAPTSSSTPMPSMSSDGSATPKPVGPSLAVKIEGDVVSPNAQRLTVKAGDPITITFTTDRPGELHVHSKPEQFVEFDAGSTTKQLVIETPGLVEVEEHDTSAVVAQIEVR